MRRQHRQKRATFEAADILESVSKASYDQIMHSARQSTTLKRFYTPAEVADILQVSSTTVMRWIHEDRLAAVRISERIYRISAPAFERFQAGTRPPAFSGRLRRVTRHPDLPVEATASAETARRRK
jgi:excisionase family DNA binding protein